VGLPSRHFSSWTILPLAICSLPGRAMRLAPIYPFLIVRHLSLSPSLVHMVPFPFHHPSTAYHVSPLLPRIAFHHMSPSRHFSYTSSLLSAPHCFGPITPLLCPIFHIGFHPYSSSHLVIPGGSAGGPPRCRSAELVGLSSILMKQLLKWLVVVRHRLCHNGKSQQ
jgi:hypothetical protein